MTETKPEQQHEDEADSSEGAISTSEASASSSADPAEAESHQDEPGEDKAAKAEEYYNQLVRTMADFDNFKKRAARERTESVRYACSSLLERLLPVLDNLEMALSATEKAQDQSVSSLQTGVLMVLQQLKSALKESGLEEIDAAGQAFNPNLHEAVSQQETDAVPEGHVALQLRKGYKLHDRLLRPASVVVAKAPAPQDGPEEANVSGS